MKNIGRPWVVGSRCCAVAPGQIATCRSKRCGKPLRQRWRTAMAVLSVAPPPLLTPMTPIRAGSMRRSARSRARAAKASPSIWAADAGLRLDRWFHRHFPALSHGALQKLLRTGQVRIDGKRVEGKDRVEPGQTVRLPPGVTAAPPPKSKEQPVVSDRDAAEIQHL